MIFATGRVIRVLAAGATFAAAAWPAAARSAGAPLRQVSYRGHRFSVPQAWPVTDLARHPTA